MPSELRGWRLTSPPLFGGMECLRPLVSQYLSGPAPLVTGAEVHPFEGQNIIARARKIHNCSGKSRPLPVGAFFPLHPLNRRRRCHCFLLNDNQLAGSIPPLTVFEKNKLGLLSCSNNLLEGSLPDVVHTGLDYLDISGRAGVPSQVYGPLPANFGRSTRLKYLIAAQQALEGVIPPFAATMSIAYLGG